MNKNLLCLSLLLLATSIVRPVFAADPAAPVVDFEPKPAQTMPRADTNAAPTLPASAFDELGLGIHAPGSDAPGAHAPGAQSTSSDPLDNEFQPQQPRPELEGF